MGFQLVRINQFGHPYQGNLYFNAGRANGLSFWESAPLAALGSATWEYFGEKNHASINDFVTTTMGGIALGEMFHRAGWMVRDARESGGKRRTREILAMLVDPITGANRFLNGEASRVSENPPGLKPTSTVGDFEAGAQWNGEPNSRAVNATGKPYVGIQLGYNDIFSSPSRLPFDAFNVTLRVGGGAGISEAAVRGRLYGRFFGDAKNPQPTEFLVLQAYDYQSNGIFDYGGQSVVLGMSRLFRLSDSVRLAGFGVGGPIGLARSPRRWWTPRRFQKPARRPSSAPTISGPGSRWPPARRWRVRGFSVLRFAFGGFLIRSTSSVEGVGARHYAQFVRLDALAPLWRQLRLGVSVDYFTRSVDYRDAPDVHQSLPQLRVYLAKVSR